jgi:endoglucanase
VIDLHAIPRPDEIWGTKNLIARLWPDYLKMVEKVAQGLGGLPVDRVAFEQQNKPTNDCDAGWGEATPQWPAMVRAMHLAARRGAPDLPIVFSGACWGGVEGLEQIDPALIADKNVFWSFQSDDPFAFTHQGASWTDAPGKYITGLPYPPSLLDDRSALATAAHAGARMVLAEGAADTEAIAATIADYAYSDASLVATQSKGAGLWADTATESRATA